jgi:hypothetical protein
MANIHFTHATRVYALTPFFHFNDTQFPVCYEKDKETKKERVSKESKTKRESRVVINLIKLIC